MRKTILVASLTLNLVLIAFFVAVAYRFREDIAQRRIEWAGSAQIALLGDSHTAGGNWSFLLGRFDVLRAGKGGLTSQQIKALLPGVLRFHPRYCFVLCGGNDITLADYSAQKTLVFYQSIADTLTRHGITPVFQSPFSQTTDTSFNACAAVLADSLGLLCKRRRIAFLDIRPALCPLGRLQAELALPDGVHLSPAGYQAWAYVLRGYLAQHGI